MVVAGVIPSLLGAPVVDADGVATGVVADLLADGRTGRPAWIVVALHGDGPVACVPVAALRTRTRSIQVGCRASALAEIAGAPPEPLLGRRFGVGPWDLPPLEALRGLDAGGARRPLVAAA